MTERKMKTSKREDYAIVLMTALAKENDFVSLRTLAEKHSLPYPFMKQIANDLVNAELLETKGGVTGGYKLAKSAEKISWREIMTAVSGEVEFVECLKKDATCCPMHEECPAKKAWKQLNNAVLEALDGIKLSKFE